MSPKAVCSIVLEEEVVAIRSIFHINDGRVPSAWNDITSSIHKRFLPLSLFSLSSSLYPSVRLPLHHVNRCLSYAPYYMYSYIFGVNKAIDITYVRCCRQAMVQFQHLPYYICCTRIYSIGLALWRVTASSRMVRCQSIDTIMYVCFEMAVCE